MIPKIIKELDLEPLIVKAMDAEEGMGWALEYAIEVAEEYRKYLTLCLENPKASIVPSQNVDKFWHLHILDTQKYQEDFQNVFGYFLHHFPYFGMRGEKDAQNLQQAWEESCAVYAKRFGGMDKALWQSSARCPNCGRRGGSEDAYASEERPRLSLAA